MTKVGTVLSLFYVSGKEHLNVDLFQLDEKGILNHKHYNKDMSRSVLITSIESYSLAKKNNITLSHGILGENILIDYNPYNLKEGDRLTVGEVVLEISQPCTLCKGLTQIDSRLPLLLKNDRGIFAKVIKSGFINKGDEIYL